MAAMHGWRSESGDATRMRVWNRFISSMARGKTLISSSPCENDARPRPPLFFAHHPSHGETSWGVPRRIIDEDADDDRLLVMRGRGRWRGDFQSGHAAAQAGSEVSAE